MRTPFSDISTRRHALTGTGWPEIQGTTLPVASPVGEDRTIPLDATHRYYEPHAYTYGLSNPALRPVVPNEHGNHERRTHIIVKPRPAARTRNRRVQTPEVARTYMVAEPVITADDRRRIRYRVVEPAFTPVSGNRDMSVETMLADLLDPPKSRVDWQ